MSGCTKRAGNWGEVVILDSGALWRFYLSMIGPNPFNCVVCFSFNLNILICTLYSDKMETNLHCECEFIQ